MIILSYIASFFWRDLGNMDTIYLGLIAILLYGFSVGGFFAGMVEIKRKGKIVLVGILGNSLLIILFIIFFCIVISEMTQ
ncbi:hypothetical protein SCB49_10842 [unidentified eubacterium SCB49]|nr:hypothetical protein SCB49_10842 [unidentified eubacterium SCB49]